jgi:hypothetical protein
MIDELYTDETGDVNDSPESSIPIEDTMVQFIQEYCHANGYYLSKLEILKL